MVKPLAAGIFGVALIGMVIWLIWGRNAAPWESQSFALASGDGTSGSGFCMGARSETYAAAGGTQSFAAADAYKSYPAPGAGSGHRADSAVLEESVDKIIAKADTLAVMIEQFASKRREGGTTLR